MTTPPSRPAGLHDEVYIFPRSLSVAIAALGPGRPVQFSLHPTPAEVAAGWGGYAAIACLPGEEPVPSISPEVARRIGYYIGRWISGHLEGDWMYQTAHRWPAWDRTHVGPVAAECGWTGYVDAAAIRKITQGEAR
jgi:hypothetical protein